jgi:hypothetical protein
VILIVLNVASTGYDAWALRSDPSAVNAVSVLIDMVDPSPMPWTGARQTMKVTLKYVSKTTGRLILKDIPIQTHHILSNINQIWTKQFKQITDKYGLDLDGDWNKIPMPQLGRHPEKYPEWVLKELEKIDSEANGHCELFLRLFDERIRDQVQKHPEMLFSNCITMDELAKNLESTGLSPTIVDSLLKSAED